MLFESSIFPSKYLWNNWSKQNFLTELKPSLDQSEIKIETSKVSGFQILMDMKYSSSYFFTTLKTHILPIYICFYLHSLSTDWNKTSNIMSTYRISDGLVTVLFFGQSVYFPRISEWKDMSLILVTRLSASRSHSVLLTCPWFWESFLRWSSTKVLAMTQIVSKSHFYQ